MYLTMSVWYLPIPHSTNFRDGITSRNWCEVLNNIHQTFACFKSTVETLEKAVKYFQS